jgi:hypothetical protein
VIAAELRDTFGTAAPQLVALLKFEDSNVRGTCVSAISRLVQYGKSLPSFSSRILVELL